jgi:hypothetical protein
MDLLVIPIEDEVSGSQNRVTKNLLVAGRYKTNVARSRSKLKNKVAEGNFNDFIAKPKINRAIEVAVFTVGHVKTLTIVLSIESLQDWSRDRHVHAGESRSRVEHNVGVRARDTNVLCITANSDAEAIQLHGETVLTTLAANDRARLQLANILTAINTAVD